MFKRRTFWPAVAETAITERLSVLIENILPRQTEMHYGGRSGAQLRPGGEEAVLEDVPPVTSHASPCHCLSLVSASQAALAIAITAG